MATKIYISGKITGIENEARDRFARAERMLSEMGFDVVNPMTINHDHDKSWFSYMREDVKAMCCCDAIFMLSNWQDSRGATIEHDIAIKLGLEPKYEIIENILK